MAQWQSPVWLSACVPERSLPLWLALLSALAQAQAKAKAKAKAKVKALALEPETLP